MFGLKHWFSWRIFETLQMINHRRHMLDFWESIYECAMSVMERRSRKRVILEKTFTEFFRFWHSFPLSQLKRK